LDEIEFEKQLNDLIEWTIYNTKNCLPMLIV
jgi:hypothetical protein